MKLQMTPRFPAQVVGSGLITVTTANGIVTISLVAQEPVIFAADGTVANKTPTAAVVRNNPATTNLLLPSVLNQGGIPLTIVDYSVNVVQHTINLTPVGAETIMRQPTWQMFSNAQQLAAITLFPSTTLNGWYIA